MIHGTHLWTQTLLSSTLIATAAYGQTVIKIAVVGPLTGPSAHYGKDNERGAQMAIDDLNQRKVKLAGKPVRFELVSEDDHADAAKAAELAKKLVALKVNGVVGHNNSGATLSAAQIYNTAGLVNITPAATNPKLTKLGYKATFRTIAHDGLMGNALASHAVAKLKVRDAAIIHDGTSYGQALAQEFEATFQSFGGRIVERHTVDSKTVDFSALSSSLAAKKPQLIFFGGLDNQAGPLLQQLKINGLEKVPFMGGDGICSADMPKLSGGAAGAQVICADGGEALTNTVQGREFAQRFKQRYSADVLSNAALAYDNTLLLAEAMRISGSSDPSNYVDALSKIKFNGGISGMIEFDGSGQRKKAAVTLSHYPTGIKTSLTTMK